MVDEISPNYYAKNQATGSFTLTGKGFDVIPQNALGLMSYINSNPLQYQNDESPVHIYDIVEKTDSSLRLQVRESRTLTHNNYLGAIVSTDRKATYWINQAKPLPVE